MQSSLARAIYFSLNQATEYKTGGHTESKCRIKMLHGCRGREGVIRKCSFNKISSSNIMADAGLTSRMDFTIGMCYHRICLHRKPVFSEDVIRLGCRKTRMKEPKENERARV